MIKKTGADTTEFYWGQQLNICDGMLLCMWAENYMIHFEYLGYPNSLGKAAFQDAFPVQISKSKACMCTFFGTREQLCCITCLGEGPLYCKPTAILRGQFQCWGQGVKPCFTSSNDNRTHKRQETSAEAVIPSANHWDGGEREKVALCSLSVLFLYLLQAASHWRVPPQTCSCSRHPHRSGSGPHERLNRGCDRSLRAAGKGERREQRGHAGSWVKGHSQ